MTHLTSDVLVIRAAGAGVCAALAAVREGARLVLTDRNLTGRAGATVMAQMTLAAATSCPPCELLRRFIYWPSTSRV
ncbi:MAG: hypothetical protein AAF458_04945 [Pseudomonadota bacterium]